MGYNHNKRVRREALREELQAKEYLRQLDEIDKEITENWRSLSSENTSALRLKADINFKRLSKCLPDLKAIEHSGDDGGGLKVIIEQFGNKTTE